MNFVLPVIHLFKRRESCPCVFSVAHVFGDINHIESACFASPTAREFSSKPFEKSVVFSPKNNLSGFAVLLVTPNGAINYIFVSLHHCKWRRMV